jgi:DNA-binding GntR family transcriptional regulator
MTQGVTMRTAVIRPLQRPVPLRQSVYDALIDLIVSGELPPGQHMVETDLARQLGVSRQPIREALHRMEAEGWVDLRPSQGAFVHVPTGSEVNELLDVRALLEAETARLAARAASPAQVARLREMCAAGQAAAEADDLSGAVAANDMFHAEIAVVAGNSVLAELADIVGRRVQWYYRMVAPERGHGSWAEHAELIDAIEASDPEQAQLLARKHTERTREAYHRALFLPILYGSLTTLTGSGAYGSFALSMSSISPRSDMMWYDPSARYSRMTVCVPSACRYRSSV